MDLFVVLLRGQEDGPVGFLWEIFFNRGYCATRKKSTLTRLPRWRRCYFRKKSVQPWFAPKPDIETVPVVLGHQTIEADFWKWPSEGDPPNECQVVTTPEQMRSTGTKTCLTEINLSTHPTCRAADPSIFPSQTDAQYFSQLRARNQNRCCRR